MVVIYAQPWDVEALLSHGPIQPQEGPDLHELVKVVLLVPIGLIFGDIKWII